MCVVQEEKENILKILEHHKITYTPTPKTIPLKVRSVGVGSVHVRVRSVGVCMYMLVSVKSVLVGLRRQ